MTPIKAVITDFSGVLVDDGLQKTLRRYASETGMPIGCLQEANTKHWIPFSLGEITEDAYWSGLFGELSLDYDIEQEKQRLRDAHMPCQSMIDFFRSLRGNAGYKTGLITNNAREWFEWFNRGLGLSGMFDVVVSSHACRTRKPSALIYDITLNGLDVPAEQTAILDDQQRNLDYPRNIGMKTILHTSPESSIEALRQYGVKL